MSRQEVTFMSGQLLQGKRCYEIDEHPQMLEREGPYD